MKEPKLIQVGDRKYWTTTTTETIEYLLREHHVLRSAEIKRLLTDRYSIDLVAPQLSLKLRTLVEAGRVVKLSMGLFAHSESPYA